MISLANPTHSGTAKDFPVGATITGYYVKGKGMFRGFRMKPTRIEIHDDCITFVCMASYSTPKVEVSFYHDSEIEWTEE